MAWILVRAGVVDVSSGMVLPMVIIGVGALTMLAAFDGAHPGLIGLGVVLSVLGLFAAILPFDGVGGGIGDRLERITTMAQIGETHELAIGELQIDLRDLEVTGPATLRAEVGIGSLVVIVPPDMAVQVRATSDLGEVDLFGTSSSGFDVDREGSFGERADLTLDLATVLGSVEVRR